jgi:hypothetical protein
MCVIKERKKRREDQEREWLGATGRRQRRPRRDGGRVRRRTNKQLFATANKADDATKIFNIKARIFKRQGSNPTAGLKTRRRRNGRREHSWTGKRALYEGERVRVHSRKKKRGLQGKRVLSKKERGLGRPL